MPCYRPLTAFRTLDGAVVFKTVHPLPKLELPCGTCIGCRLDKAREWAIRCVHEAQMHEKNSFLTMTYAPECLPKGGTLVKKDVQSFLKRIRSTVGKVRYLCVGEYGDRTNRPHYHMLVFGMDFWEGSSQFNVSGKGHPLRMSDSLNALWSHGKVYIGNVTLQSAGYCARYALKKVGIRVKDDQYHRYDSNTGESWYVAPEFVTMSLKPGIGATWYDRYWSEVRATDNVVFDGEKFRVPKYYDKLLDRFAPEELISVKAKRVEAARAHADNCTEERLIAREAVQVARASKLVRSSN